MSGFHKLSEVSLCQALGTPDQDTHTPVSMWKDVTQNLRQGDTRGSEKRGAGWGGDTAKEASEEEQRVSEQWRAERGLGGVS